jgi:hypothetical protein
MIRNLFLLAGLVVILCSLTACSHPSADNVQDDDAAKTIRIEERELHHFQNLHDLYASIRLIPLETNDSCLMADPRKIIAANNRFYILSAHAVFLFNADGTFLRRIHHRGRGPHEYIELDDFAVTENGNIEIAGGNKIMKYTTDDSLLLEQNLPQYVDRIAMLSENLTVCHNSTYYPLYLWNANKKKVVNLLQKDEKKSILGHLPLIQYHDIIYYQAPYSSDILQVTPDGTKKEWHIDFDKRNITNLVQTVIGQYSVYAPEPHMADINLFLETDNYVYIDFSVSELGDYPLKLFYSKESRKNRVHNDNLLFEEEFSFPSPTAISEDNCFMEILSPIYIFKRLEDWGKTLTDPEDRALLESLKAQMANVTPEDNPVICVYTLQDF